MASVSIPCSPHRAEDRVRPQRNLSFHQYLTERDWSNLRDDSVDLSAKFRVMVTRAMRLGMSNPSEHTFVQMLATVLAAGSYEHTVVSSVQGLQMIKDLKCLFKAHRRRAAKVAGMDLYPPVPEEMRKHHEAAHPASSCSFTFAGQFFFGLSPMRPASSPNFCVTGPVPARVLGRAPREVPHRRGHDQCLGAGFASALHAPKRLIQHPPRHTRMARRTGGAQHRWPDAPADAGQYCPADAVWRLMRRHAPPAFQQQVGLPLAV